MSSSQKASAATSDNVAKLHKLLQRPESKDRIGPLMAAVMAQNIHIHTKTITDLDSKVQQIRGSQSEQANHVSERIHEFQQDLMSLRELIPADKQIIKDIKADTDELKDEIAEAMKQCHVESARIEQGLKVVREMMETRIERDAEAVCEAMEREQQASKKIADNYKNMMQHMESLKHDVNGIKGAIEKKLSDPLITESIMKLEERVTRSVDQISTTRKEIGDIKTSLAAIETKGGLGNLVWGEPAGHDVPDQSTINDRALGHISNNQGKSCSTRSCFVVFILC
ncbi:hypothetical protein EKO27_g2880 [Xylaria grammica]|uniref:Uncharacterized protein n=1 Tax=Xylaria grammica TaxID=363999 RepID=A0A439DCQ3_9PEZI|nr:hypothetical protein EKO27_g2880 [Xylaria grammica]